MHHRPYIAVFLLAVLCGCNRPVIATSERGSDDDKTKHSTEVEATTPKQWPKCWLSFRLSVMNAFRIADSRKEGRQEFRGTSANPTTSGDCVLNWFGKDNDNAKEPWVTLFKEKFESEGYRAVVSCRADPTPDCLCAATLPINKNGLLISVDLCVRDNANNHYELYSVHAERPDTETVPATSDCLAARNKVTSTAKHNIEQASFLQQNQDRQESDKDGVVCRTDFEPFDPLPDEQDWYADEVRDWAVTTCTHQQSGCRCYAIHNKSGKVAGERSALFDNQTCLLCENDTCQLVAF